MTKKSVPVAPHKRSTPKTPAWKGPGNKPGPKPVGVPGHKRSSPKARAERVSPDERQTASQSGSYRHRHLVTALDAQRT